MEAFQLRRSSTAATGAYISGHRPRNGKGRVQKHRNFPKLASDSSSWSSDTTEEDSFNCELGLRSSKQAVGTPMKKLLAEEMSRESESKRRSPSVIARLMGLDGLPTQQSSHKQHKRFSENSVQRTVPTEKTRRNSSSYGSWSSRKSSKEEQEFKDVFEVFDESKMESSSYSSQETAHTKVSEVEMAFIEQKFMNAKCLSTNEELQNSKEFHDAIDDLDSNKELLLKFLEQPDSLYAKHLHDLQGASLQSSWAHAHQSAIKSSNSPQYESSGLGCKIERDRWKNRRKPHDDPFSCSYSKSAAHNLLRRSKVQLEGKDKPALPTRIVVLKPNLGKVQSATKAVSSPRSSQNFLSNCRKHTELPGIKNRDVECGKENFSDDAGPSRYKSRESREIAKEVTRQMRNRFSNGSMNISTSGFNGYAGDQSSSIRSENESANELEETTVTPRNSISWRNRYRPSTSFSTESSVSREARKRLSERWKITHKSVDMGVVNRSSTLGEMLAIADGEVRPENSDVMIGKKEFFEKFDGNDGMAGWVQPLGISSSDGWKDGCIGSLSRSRSVPASSTFSISSTKTGICSKTPLHGRYLMPKQVVQMERTNVKGNLNQRLSSRNSRSRTKISHAARCAYSDCSDTSPEIHFWQNQSQRNVTENYPFEQDPTVSETSNIIVKDTSLVPKNVVDVTIENMVVPSKPTDKESSADMLAKGDSSTGDLEILPSQELTNMPPENGPIPMHHPVAELESPASSKEADQPSPVSVLETPFPDDLSSGSECFESLSADLHGLRMQLQLLKLESDECVDRPMLISSDGDAEEGSAGFSEDRGIVQESREFSYIRNMLVDSGINDVDPDTFSKYHSPECPVNPAIFEELEKKYSNHASWPRSERRLLFDRINLALLMIYEQFVDPHPWLRPATGIRPRWIKNGLKDGIKKMLTSQDKKVNIETAAEMVLDMRDDIDIIGRDIEKLLTEELVNELVGM